MRYRNKKMIAWSIAAMIPFTMFVLWIIKLLICSSELRKVAVEMLTAFGTACGITFMLIMFWVGFHRLIKEL